MDPSPMRLVSLEGRNLDTQGRVWGCTGRSWVIKMQEQKMHLKAPARLLRTLRKEEEVNHDFFFPRAFLLTLGYVDLVWGILLWQHQQITQRWSLRTLQKFWTDPCQLFLDFSGPQCSVNYIEWISQPQHTVFSQDASNNISHLTCFPA